MQPQPDRITDSLSPGSPTPAQIAALAYRLHVDGARGHSNVSMEDWLYAEYLLKTHSAPEGLFDIEVPLRGRGINE